MDGPRFVAAAILAIGALDVCVIDTEALAQVTGGTGQVGTWTPNDGLCANDTSGGQKDCGFVGNAPAFALSYNPGQISALVASKPLNVAKIPKTAVVDNIELAAQSFTCSVNPVIAMEECGTSATCTSPTVIGSGTLTAAGTIVDGTISSATITAGDYVGWEVTAGTCTALDASAVAMVHYL